MGDGCVLAKEDERLVVKREGEVLQTVPALKVDQVMVFGNSALTTPAMNFCLQQKIPIVLLSSRGRYFGVIDAFDTDPVLLHRDQFARAADAGFCLGVARAIVRGKLANSRLVLRRFSRKREAPALEKADHDIGTLARSLESASSLDALRGVEGTAARYYFSAFRSLLAEQWGFAGRRRRPPPDPVNALLSYGYTLLYYNLYALVRARGLNPHVGFLHPLRAGHPALVSDLIEEFRSIVVDALVLTLLLNERFTANDFLSPDDRGARLLTDPARRRFVHAFEAKMNAAVTHPGTGQRLDYRRCMEQQVQALAAVVRGRREDYVPMMLR